MLVLTRRVDQALLIGDAMVRVLGISGNKVKLGIEAPPSIDVRRLQVSLAPSTDIDRLELELEIKP